MAFQTLTQFGQLVSGVTPVTSNYTMTGEEDMLKVFTSGGAYTITLPDAGSIEDGRRYTIRDVDNNAGVNAVTLTPQGGQTINDLPSFQITANSGSIFLDTTGSQWFASVSTPTVTSLNATINQTAHGFVIGDVVGFNGISYAKSQADSSTNAEVYGLVSSIIDVDAFQLAYSGYVDGLTGLTSGAVHFLSATTAGLLTATEPTAIGEVSVPLFLADSTTSGVFVNKRGALNGTTTAGLTVETQTADVTLTGSNKLELADATAADFTITLPTAVGLDGEEFEFVKTDSSANTVTIDADGTETINGDATQTLSAQWDSIFIRSDGANWVQVGGGSGDAWALAGNTGITGATDFLGTTDLEDLHIKTNGTDRAVFSGLTPLLSLGTSAAGFTVSGPSNQSLVVQSTGSGVMQIGADTGNIQMGFPNSFSGNIIIGSSTSVGNITLGAGAAASSITIGGTSQTGDIIIAPKTSGATQTVSIAPGTGDYNVSIGGGSGNTMSLDLLASPQGGGIDYLTVCANGREANMTFGSAGSTSENQDFNVFSGSTTAIQNVVFFQDSTGGGNQYFTIGGSSITNIVGIDIGVGAVSGAGQLNINIGTGGSASGVVSEVRIGDSSTTTDSKTYLNGAVARSVRSVSASETLPNSTNIVFATGTITLTLPTGFAGQVIDIKNISTDTVTVSGTIDTGTSFAVASFALTDDASQTLASDGAGNWYRL